MILGRGEEVCQSIHRGRRCGDQLADSFPRRCLDYVEGAIDEYLDSQPRLLGALGDPDRGLMEDHVDATHELGDELAITDVALYDADRSRGERADQIL